MKKLIEKFILIAITCTLSACMVGPEYVAPTFDIAEKDLTADAFYRDDGLWKDAMPIEDMPKGNWWAIFEDSQLDELLVLAQKNNPSLASAFYSVEALFQNARIDSSELFPQINGNASFSRTAYDAYYNNNFYNNWLTGFTLTWDIDLFGRIRRILEADVADAQAEICAYNSLILSLQTKVAISYFTIMQYESEIELIKASLASRKEQTKYVENRVEHKIATQLDLHRALAQESDAESQLATMQGYISLEKNNMAILVGIPPSQLELKLNRLSESLPKAPRAVPSQLLERRPDVAQAERSVFAANSRIGAAQAGFFPTISISANANLSATEFDRLLETTSFAWGISPQIYIPIFQAGKIYAQKQVALASHKKALEEYKNTVLNAIGDVENALATINYLENQSKATDKYRDENVEIFRLTQMQFKSGIIDYFLVSDASTVLLSAQRESIRINGQRYQALVNLIAALGGGFSDKEEKENSEIKTDEIPMPYKNIESYNPQ